jgi:hypothetical protein
MRDGGIGVILIAVVNGEKGAANITDTKFLIDIQTRP